MLELDDVVDRELDRFRKVAKDADSAEGLHAARIRAKRVRYAAEVARRDAPKVWSKLA